MEGADTGDRRHVTASWGWSMLAVLAIVALLGVAHLVYVVGFRVALASLPLWRNPPGDLAQSVLGAEAFLLDRAWHFPLAATGRLISDGRPLSIVYTDSAPWVAITAKLLGLRTTEVSVMGLTLCLSFLLQPIAVALLLLAAGVRRTEVVVLGSVLGALLPAWYMRASGHVALSSHWLVALALALAVLAVRRGVTSAVIAGFGLLGIAALGFHAYLFAMVAAVAIGGLLADSARVGRPALLRTVAGIALFLALSSTAAWLLGYGGGGVGGFGIYSMNLLSPIVPQISGLSEMITGNAGRVIDATGGQYEGYNYLGAGLLLVLGLALLSRYLGGREVVTTASSRRAAFPLALALLGLTALAISNRVFLGQKLVLAVASHGAIILNEARSSGRFFWPVSYILLTIALVKLDKFRHRQLVFLCLAVAAIVQFADTGPLRRGVRQAYAATPGPPGAEFDPWMHGTLAGRNMRMLPRFLCARPDDEALIREISLMSVRSGARVEGGPQARMRPDACVEDQFTAAEVAQARSGGDWVDVLFRRSLTPPTFLIASESGRCAPVAFGEVCGLGILGSRATDSSASVVAPLEDGARIDLSSMGDGRRIEGPGWSDPEPFGTWTEARKAVLVLPLSHGWKGGVTVSLEARAFAPPPLSGQKVELSVGSHVVANLDISRSFEWFRVNIPHSLWNGGLVILDLDIPGALSPYASEHSLDRRLLGITLRTVSVNADAS